MPDQVRHDNTILRRFTNGPNVKPRIPRRRLLEFSAYFVGFVVKSSATCQFLAAPSKFTVTILDTPCLSMVTPYRRSTISMDLRLWVRNNATPTYASPGVGFRCARDQ